MPAATYSTSAGSCGARAIHRVARVIGEGDLGGRIVHHDEVAHAGGGGAAADHAGFGDEDGETRGGAFGRAGGADDAAAGDGYVEA